MPRPRKDPLASWTATAAIASLLFAGGCEGTISSSDGASVLRGGSGSMASDPTKSKVAATDIPYARLTRAEYRATILAALGVDPDLSGIPEDGRIGAYTSNIDVHPDPLQPYLLASEDLVAQLIPSKLPTCAATDASGCIEKNYKEPFEKLYRRPLTGTEITTFADLVSRLTQAGVTAENATRSMTSAALLQPDFLFRSAPFAAPEARVLRLAEHLSYALWDAPPDSGLASVGTGPAAELAGRLGVQVKRLAADERAVPILARFIGQWLRVDVDMKLGETGFVGSAHYAELLAFVRNALATNAPIKSFVNGKEGFVQGDSTDYPGITPSTAGTTVGKVAWPATSSRRGILGEELFLDATRHPDATRRPIFRGHLVRSSLLCTSITPPPPELLALAAEVTDRLADSRCKGCHSLMEPVGKAFAGLDPDNKNPVPAPVLTDDDELGGRQFKDLPDMLDAIADSNEFASCFSRQFLAFFFEIDPELVGDDWVASVATQVKGGASLGDVFEYAATSLSSNSSTAIAWCDGR